MSKITFPIGLDISDISLKAVQITKKKKKLTINAVSKFVLKNGIIENGVIRNTEAFIEALQTLRSKTLFGSFSGNEIVACLPDTKTFIKLLEIEKNANKLPLQVPFELEKNFPVQEKEVYYDWQLIREDQDLYHVLLGAAPRTIVDQYINILKQAKFSVQALEIETVALSRCLLPDESLEKNIPTNSYCLIDIGAKRTSLTIYAQKSIITSVSLPISSDATTDLISKTLEINKEQAEKAKIICGLDKNQAHGIVANILSEMVNELIGKIDQTINFYHKHYSNENQINEIILCGGGANIKDLNKTIEEKIGIKATVGNVFKKIDIEEEIINKIFVEKHNLDTREMQNFEDNYLVKKQNASQRYATAIGLALRNVLVKEN